MILKARVIAFYLPQFHQVSENDKWWGKGFTEWTNVKKALPLFKHHYQPRIPSELGYYDLTNKESRDAQAKLAKKYGVEGFCYWHYWFGNGKRLLEQPFNEVLKLGDPDLPFCLGWANESWQGFDFGTNGRNILLEQKYPGKQDIIDHFNTVLPAFLDERYIKIDDKPLFYIYRPSQLPNPDEFIKMWQELALENGLKGIFFVCQSLDLMLNEHYLHNGFDAINTNRFGDLFKKQSLLSKLKKRILRAPTIFSYEKAVRILEGEEDKEETIFPTLMPNWDHTPRTGKRGNLFHESNPDLFKLHTERVYNRVKHKEKQHKVIFLKSWNEWAEGNYMEPDKKFGRAYLEALKSVISDNS